MLFRTSLFFLSSLSVYAYIIPARLRDSVQLTWTQAEHHCNEQYNTHLASIHSESDWRAVISLISDFEANFWIGLITNSSQRTTHWSDGSLFNNESQNILQWNYHNHSSILRTNHCITLQQYDWYVVDCNAKYYPLCGGNRSDLNIFKTSTNVEYIDHIEINHKSKDMTQRILDNDWLVFALSLLIGFLLIGIIYCLMIVVCVSYLNIKSLKLSKKKRENKDNVDVDITITKHYEKEIILDEKGQILTGVIKKQNKFKYKQRTLTIPKSPCSRTKSPCSRTKSPQSYNKSIQTSLNVRYPESTRSTSCTEGVALIADSYTMKDIISTVDGLALDSSAEYFPNVKCGRMTIGDMETHHEHGLSAEELAIKENICSIEMNLKIMQMENMMNESDLHLVDEDTLAYTDTETYY